MHSVVKSIAVACLTAILTAGAYFIIGPQIMIIVPVAVLAGVVLAFRRSFLSLVCFGYPFTFGLVSAVIGCSEITGYERTAPFIVSVLIGIAGVGLMAAGLWKAMPKRTNGTANWVAQRSPGGDSLESLSGE